MLLLIVAEGALTVLQTYALNHIHQNESNPFSNSKFNGSSGLFLAWLVYASIDSLLNHAYDSNPYFYILGFLPVYWSFAPLLTALLIPIVSLRMNGAVANIAGLFTGYLFAFGVIAILPDLYWTLCLLLNGSLFLATTAANAGISPTTVRSLYNVEDEVLGVNSFSDPHAASRSAVGTSSDLESAEGVHISRNPDGPGNAGEESKGGVGDEEFDEDASLLAGSSSNGGGARGTRRRVSPVSVASNGLRSSNSVRGALSPLSRLSFGSVLSTATRLGGSTNANISTITSAGTGSVQMATTGSGNRRYQGLPSQDRDHDGLLGNAENDDEDEGDFHSKV